MTAEFGAPSQLEKIEMLDYADLVAVNKFTRRGSEDALRAVRKQLQRNRKLFDVPPERLPVFGTSAAHFHDRGVNALYGHLVARLVERLDLPWRSGYAAGPERTTDGGRQSIPAQRERYLSEISERCRGYRRWAEEQAEVAAELEAVEGAMGILRRRQAASGEAALDDLEAERVRLAQRLDGANARLLAEWPRWDAAYESDRSCYSVRGRDVEVDNHRSTLSGTRVPKVARPRYRAAGDRLRWRLLENVPGEFPYTGGVFPFKRTEEDPTRMFAGEGPAERTNRRFHYLADGQPAKRLSTAFDSVTLYGEDPTSGRTSTARSARAASPCAPSKRPSGSTPASTSALPPLRCR